MVLSVPLDIVIWLQELSSPFMDFVWNFVSLFGEEYLYIAVLGLIYWIINKRMGEFVGIALGTTISLNNVLKDIIGAQRPYQEYPDLVDNKRGYTATGYSMPSGHVQGSSTFFVAIAYYVKRRWMMVCAISITLLMMISRMYLGVHYIQDVLVGGLLGIAVAIGMMVMYRRYEGNDALLHRFYVIVLIVFFPFFFILQGNDFFRGYGILVGLVFGVIFEKNYVKFTMDISIYKKVLRYVFGLISMVGALVGFGMLFALFADSGWLKNVLDFVRYFMIAFVGFGLYPWVFKRLKF